MNWYKKANNETFYEHEHELNKIGIIVSEAKLDDKDIIDALRNEGFDAKKYDEDYDLEHEGSPEDIFVVVTDKHCLMTEGSNQIIGKYYNGFGFIKMVNQLWDNCEDLKVPVEYRNKNWICVRLK